MSTDDKKVMLSGVQPSGDLHIGNYFGAIRQFVELANSDTYQVFVMIADYHALNTIQNAEEMRRRTNELVLGYLACGLDPQKVTIFKQSDVPAHAELAWIFDTIVTMPYLMRAHAFKDAEAKNKEISVGKFNYPILMAADILLYQTNVVPVGNDQKQHVEYARDIAEKFNRTFACEAFVLPEAYIKDDVAVVPGIDGQKMSKSYGNVISLFASPEETAKQVMSIVTDSSGDRPKNVYAIHKLVKAEEDLNALYQENKGNYKVLKEKLTEDLNAYFAPMRAKYEELKDNPSVVNEVLERGGERAREVADAHMQVVRKSIGVR